MTGRSKLLVVALAGTALTLAGVQLPTWLPAGGADVVYETVEADHGQIRRFVATSGPVRALVTVSVGSQLSGQIRELKADFNSEVRAGDELAIIDDKTYLARQAQARSDLAAARALLANQQAALIKAQAVARNAAQLMRRQSALAEKGIAAASALDAATRDFEVASAEVAVAEAQVQNAHAMIAQREAQLAQVEIDLERTRIRSPIDGIVIVRAVDVGQTVAASLQAPELFKIAQDLRRVRIEAQVSEADVGAIAAGNGVAFRVDAYPERSFAGRVIQVRLGANEINNVVTYTVIIDADNEDRRLLPGMTVDARIESTRIDNTLRVPLEALRFRPRGAAAVAAERLRAEHRLEKGMSQAAAALVLTPEQRSRLAQLMRGSASASEAGRGTAAAFSSPGPRPETDARFTERLVRSVAAVVTETQRQAFERWRADRELAGSGRAERDVTVFVLGANDALESRQIDVGVTDEHYAQVRAGNLKAGERLILRVARRATP